MLFQDHPFFKELHPDNNFERLKRLTTKSKIPVKWQCENGHIWETSISNRCPYNRPCPYCSRKLPSSEYNLTTEHPELMKEWSKNNPKQPHEYLPNSGKKVNWICSGCGKEYPATINHRTNKNDPTGCSFCNSKKISYEKSLAFLFPEVAKDWDEILNKVAADKVFSMSSKKVNWKCNKCNYSWPATIGSRTKGNGCPACGGKVPTETNNLAVKFPHLLSDWDYVKNKKPPTEYLPSSNKYAHWNCSRGHSYRAQISNRTIGGNGCLRCKSKISKRQLKIYSELKYIFPNTLLNVKKNGYECDIFIEKYNIAIEYDGYYYHKYREEHDKEKTINLSQKGIKVIRLREKGLNLIGKNDITTRVNGNDFSLIIKILESILNITELSEKDKNKIKNYVNGGKILNNGLYDQLVSQFKLPLQGRSLTEVMPELIKEWDKNKNNIDPKYIYAHDKNKYWWTCKVCKFSYLASPDSRVRSKNSKSSGCPKCSGKIVDYDNSLQVLFPHIASSWHPIKNGNLTPLDFTPYSEKKVWWICSKKKEHEWEAIIKNRTRGTGCRFCTGRYTDPARSLAVMFPTISREWDKDKNYPFTPEQFMPRSNKSVFWICKSCNHSWRAKIYNRTLGKGCKKCKRKIATDNYNLSILYPKLIREFDIKINGNINPETILPKSNKIFNWKCIKGHFWKARVSDRTRGTQCPICRKKIKG